MTDDALLIEGRTGKWEVVIGLEIHAQVSSVSKLFSGASAAFGGAPNEHVSLVDAAMPGMLPVINRFCIEQAIKTGLGLNAKINLFSLFDRKNYFYADLPQGYQISQYKQPIVGEGQVTIKLKDGSSRKIGIERLHLEQDAGKSLHDQHPKKSYIDLNRSGVALMEIVSKPDLRSADEAAAYVTKVRSILRFLGTCDGNMEQGSLRADCNVSVRRPGEDLGTRTETKNLNSIRFIAQAITSEALRQIEVLESGGTIKQETRLFDTAHGETRTMRSKEDAHDYRYFPDPDLLPLVLDQAWVDEIKASFKPELPDALKERLMTSYGLSGSEAAAVSEDKETALFYEQTAQGRDAKLAHSWVVVELFGALNKAGLSLAQSPVTADRLGRLISRISDGTISGRIAKDVFAEMMENGGEPDTIIDQKGFKQISDSREIDRIVNSVLKENADKVAEYKAGKDKLFGFFVGQVMKASQGQANPSKVNDILKQKLAE